MSVFGNLCVCFLLCRFCSWLVGPGSSLYVSDLRKKKCFLYSSSLIHYCFLGVFQNDLTKSVPKSFKKSIPKFQLLTNIFQDISNQIRFSMTHYHVTFDIFNILKLGSNRKKSPWVLGLCQL